MKTKEPAVKKPRGKTNDASKRNFDRIDALVRKNFQQLSEELRTRQVELESQKEELRRTKIELKISQDRYQELFDRAPIGYVLLDHLGTITEVNQAGAELFRMNKRRMLGDQFYRFLKQNEDVRTFRAHRREVFLSQGRRTCEVRLTRGDGSFFHAELHSSALENSDNRAGLIRIAIIDISDRKAIEETRAQSE